MLINTINTGDYCRKAKQQNDHLPYTVSVNLKCSTLWWYKCRYYGSPTTAFW